MLTVASYNIHRCIGSDWFYRPARIVDVIRELDADVLGLQEIDAHVMHREGHQLDLIVQRTGYHLEVGSTMWREDAAYGNAVLSRVPILRSRRHDLSVDGREPRGALEVDLEIRGILLRILVTHLGLRPRERYAQVRRLLEIADAERENPLVLLGDFNEWVPRFGSTRLLGRRFTATRPLRTYPAGLPLFPFDRVYVEKEHLAVRTEVLDTPLTRRASDHLPIKAFVEVVP